MKRMHLRPLTALVVVAVAMSGAGSDAKRPPTPKLNPKIVAMADNTWLKMNPKREPEGRNYSGACFGDWGEGGRAFYFGGAHFSYKYDDVDFYDPAANKWTRSWDDRIDWMSRRAKAGKDAAARKKLRDEEVAKGRLGPVHTYQQVCWLPGRKVFFYMGRRGNWQFDPKKMKWTCLALPPLHQTGEKKTLIPWTRWAVQTMHCYYNPAVKAPICITTHKPQGDWLYDVATSKWRPLKRSIRRMGGEIYSTWVPPLKSQLLSNRVGKWHLHKVTDQGSTWTELTDVPKALKGCEALAYDEANKVVIAIAAVKGRAALPLWSMDPKTLRWTELKPKGDVPKGTGLWAPLWYDRAHNAFFFLNRTGQTGCETWVYRYKRPAAGKKCPGMWVDAKVGTMVKISVPPGTMTKEVIKADKETVTVRTTMWAPGAPAGALKPTEETINRYDTEDPMTRAVAMAAANLKVTKLPDETLMIAGKAYKCEVYEMVMWMRDKKYTCRNYMCRDVPGWLVKAESDASGQMEMRMELLEFKK